MSIIAILSQLSLSYTTHSYEGSATDPDPTSPISPSFLKGFQGIYLNELLVPYFYLPLAHLFNHINLQKNITYHTTKVSNLRHKTDDMWRPTPWTCTTGFVITQNQREKTWKMGGSLHWTWVTPTSPATCATDLQRIESCSNPINDSCSYEFIVYD